MFEHIAKAYTAALIELINASEGKGHIARECDRNRKCQIILRKKPLS